MKKRFITVPLILGLFILQGLSLSADTVKKPVDVVLMSTPFGSHMYDVGAAFEQVFKKVGSWVHIKHQETPGAMYAYRYIAKNREKMKTGQIAHTLMVGGIGAVPHLQEGRWPFNKTPWPTTKTLVSTTSLIGFYATFNPDIKTPADFIGKRICTRERSRIFLGLFLDKPLFGKGYGIYDKIKWAPLGDAGCKNALLNGQVDVAPTTYGGIVKITKDGTFVVPYMAPSPSTMEIMSSGRTIHMIAFDPTIMRRSYDFTKDMIVHPAIIKKGAVKGIKEDLWGRAGFGVIHCDAGLPDDIVKEIVRVRHEYRQEFGKHHASLRLLPDTPYPIGSPRKYVHAGVIKAMKQLGYVIPQGH